MKVLITGGHFSPAYSLVSELKSRGHHVSIAGRRYPFEDDKSESLEYKISKDQKLIFYEVKTGRFQRKFTAYTIASLLRTPAGFITSVQILSRSKPDVVLTFGGYIGLPISLAARFLGIPIVLHEQTQEAGLASKIIGKFANRICVSFKSSIKFFPQNKTILTGNPLRREIFEANKKTSIPQGKCIYVTGGSTGSHFINSQICEILPDLLSDFVIIHQTGDNLKYRDYEKLSYMAKTLPGNLRKKYILRKFIYPDEIGDVFNRADLVISRSGANVIFEIMATKKMSILIPLPHGQNKEQALNAKLLKNLGISEFIEEGDSTPQGVLSLAREMFKNQERYLENMGKTKEFITVDADKRIADIIEELTEI
jgi:UDP-N-acetylglucosamine--N-acetylmuramyl-(pentapeptide) pyrophosphoryl-undecaprenol N-acetylglucosamine transferase